MARSFVFNPFTGNFDSISEVTLAAVGSTPNANGASITTPAQVLTLQPADATHPGVVTAIAQTLGGIKTFSAQVNTDGGIDRSTAGTLSIGTNTLTTTVINLGNSNATVNIQGTTIFENTSTLQVSNPTIILNHGGGAGSGASSGITIEEASSITGYVETSADRNSWALKAPNTAGIATITPGAGGITLDQSSHDPLTIGTANGLSLSTQVLSLQLASASLTGALSSTDWNTFNNKQAAGNYITALSGDVVAAGPGSAAATIQAGVVSNSKLAAMSNNAVKANKSGSSASPSDIALGTPTEATSSVLVLTGWANSVLASPTIQVLQATTSQSGYLSNTDWNTFNNKQAAFSGLTTNGIIYATSSSAVASTTAGSQYQPMVANASGAPTFQALNLAQSAAVTGALPIANGGTGQTAKAAAFDALSPMSASGDIIYGGASGTGTRLAKGSDGQVLTLVSGVPAWAATGISSEVFVNNCSQNGSTGNRVKVFDVTALVNTGSDITWARSTVNGDTFTINTTGRYRIYYAASASGGADTFGISKNLAATTVFSSIGGSAQGLATFFTPSANFIGNCSWEGQLTAGDVIRAHQDGTTQSSSAFLAWQTCFHIIKVG